MSTVTASSVPLLAGLAAALLSGSLLVATADTGAARYLLTTGISMGVGAVSLVLLDRPLPAPARMASLTCAQSRLIARRVVNILCDLLSNPA